MKTSPYVKIRLTCPRTHADTLRLAIGDAGIGQMGNYSHCSFVVEGIGYFKPNDKANPAIGQAGEIEAVKEVLIEFLCHTDQIGLLKETLAKHHPYEEVAMDVMPLLEV